LALLRGLGWRRLAGLGHAHIGPNAEQDKGIFQAKFPLAGEEVGLAHRIGKVRGRAVLSL
jgi:hypothetical protein